LQWHESGKKRRLPHLSLTHQVRQRRYLLSFSCADPKNFRCTARDPMHGARAGDAGLLRRRFDLGRDLGQKLVPVALIDWRGQREEQVFFFVGKGDRHGFDPQALKPPPRLSRSPSVADQA
jgi:hypothetical protein